jgi:transglutaminase-like putative cysteine protease
MLRPRDSHDMREQHHPDPNNVLARWVDSFVTSRPMRTLDLLSAMNAALQPHIVYAERPEPGTQSPAETLEKKAGAKNQAASAV